MSVASESGSAPRAGERFTLIVLAAIVAVLGYVRFHLLPSQERVEPLPFAFRNPMLDAKEGERVLFHPRDNPHNVMCAIVRKEGLVLRPNRGPNQIAYHTDLRRSLPYLAVDAHPLRRGEAACAGEATESVIYALNFFGMPLDTQVRVDSIRPRWMQWGEREIAVYEVVLERFGSLSGRWTTYLAEEAPVAGLVKWTTLDPKPTEVRFREVLDLAR